MSKTDSVSSDFHNLYEQTVRESLKSILFKAFGILCREPTEGFLRYFKKGNTTSGNLFWDYYRISEIEIDFLAHVAPLSTLPAVVEENVSLLPNVQVFKSVNLSPSVATTSSLKDFQQKKSVSPEKADASTNDDFDTFQYVIAEITLGGRKSVLKKLEQLEKDCFFLCSRTHPSLTHASEFKVLETIACVAVVSPNLNATELQNALLKDAATFPLLKELFSQGRFVCIRHTETPSVIIRGMGNKLDMVMATGSEQNQALEAKLSEQNQVLEAKLSEQNQKLSEQNQKLSEQNQALEYKLSEQNQALEAKLSEQNKALSEQFLAVQQLLLSRLPESK